MRGRVGGGIPSRLAELIPIWGLDGFSCPPSFKLNRKYRIHLLFSRAYAAHERRIALYKTISSNNISASSFSFFCLYVLPFGTCGRLVSDLGYCNDVTV